MWGNLYTPPCGNGRSLQTSKAGNSCRASKGTRCKWTCGVSPLASTSWQEVVTQVLWMKDRQAATSFQAPVSISPPDDGLQLTHLLFTAPVTTSCQLVGARVETLPCSFTSGFPSDVPDVVTLHGYVVLMWLPHMVMWFWCGICKWFAIKYCFPVFTLICRPAVFLYMRDFPDLGKELPEPMCVLFIPHPLWFISSALCLLWTCYHYCLILTCFHCCVVHWHCLYITNSLCFITHL